MNGLLVIDKPGGMTSRDAVNRVQRWFPRKTKIGHTGTLDPLATGVLVVCIGAATRLADYVQAMGKSYSSRFRFGATSTTDDADGEVTETPNAPVPTREQIDAALAAFVGNVEQVPPAVSALKLDGVRAHELVRRGLGPKLNARVVSIYAIRVTGFAWPHLDVEVDCGKGTYIRSIARDLGDVLGCGGLVQTLRRTRVGPFRVEQGMSLDADPASVKLLPMAEAVAGMKHVSLNADEVIRLRHGQRIRLSENNAPPEGEELAVFDGQTGLIGIGVVERGQLKPQLVFGV
ncbi:trna pseudouridine synthase b : tRNA pseudouridine synthase B OS=Planctomyces brasiliensis (strain ATCC 49424 / DSM 5305 / JCM 21570 / NBRC 103401 / IFAM 1448) GN=truB PE=3 SV=1: TruB_N: TruB-C_2 [Gemmata massiliana]|uniref:tRNA pseudouridine synthase B n=1 Tax=Gemmata massiliana TaxID=1210884 RepID=A0A6P2D669_9BACT|nr:tRNA pseudouridine(55) synthase TruB [Gemmata massiliana]VTR96493.1 trna pseudouridine synthase b : tRNA pseudouridine synthase B OS=Planctomyces brasiliensis (strain ATCC 49424 / DSM 5305 / JCM 21570 / NBRC 103401 / IFAM 1448) GN=truB PE=3 SV=1: TruB_N: TruB-C_2 [Gemmata massiliana]